MAEGFCLEGWWCLRRPCDSEPDSQFFYGAKNILSHWDSQSISLKAYAKRSPWGLSVMDVMRPWEGAIMVGSVECLPAGRRPEPN